MAYVRVADLDELWEGEMLPVDVGGEGVLLIYPLSAEIIAIQSHCPHQQMPLADGTFDGERSLTCTAHMWQFDVRACKGINPENVRLARYPVKVDNDEIYVDLADVEPNYSGI